MPLTGKLVWNPGMYPDCELNMRHFSLWDDAQPPEPNQLRQGCLLPHFTQENTEAHRVHCFPVIIIAVNNLRFKPRLRGPRYGESTHWTPLGVPGVLWGSTSIHSYSYHPVHLQVLLQTSELQTIDHKNGWSIKSKAVYYISNILNLKKWWNVLIM